MNLFSYTKTLLKYIIWYRTDLWINPLVSYPVPKYVGRKMKQLLGVSVLGKILSIEFFK